jgi:hypothetical protein
MLMVISSKRSDTAVRISRWLDEAVENYISNKKSRLEFPSKRNFVDNAVAKLLEEKGALKLEASGAKGDGK